METLTTPPVWFGQYVKSFPAETSITTNGISKIDMQPVISTGRSGEIPWAAIGITVLIVGCAVYLIWLHQQEEKRRLAGNGM